MRKTSLLLGVTFLMTVAAGPSAVAGPPGDLVRRHVDEVVTAVKNPTLDARTREALLRKSVGEAFDFSEMARRSLGRHGERLGTVERKAFTEHFAGFLREAYVATLNRFYGQRATSFRDRTVFAAESVQGDEARVLVLLPRHGTDIPVEARMLRRGSRWMIHDIAIQGVSVTENYRAQVNHVIRTTSYDGLLRRLGSQQEALTARVARMTLAEERTPLLR
jgi:phospholipid transport system substrate-binding protein